MSKNCLFLDPSVLIMFWSLSNIHSQVLDRFPSLKALSAAAIVNHSIKVPQEALHEDLHAYLFLFESNKNNATKMLFSAIDIGYRESVIQDVLRLKVDLKATQSGSENYKHTPLIHAIKKKNDVIVDLLLRYGADPELGDSNGKRPLFHAIDSSQLNIIRSLITRHADVKTAFSCFTPLMQALIYCPESIPMLVEAGASADITGLSKNMTSLIWVLDAESQNPIQKQLEICNILLGCKASVNMADTEGRTPLIVAIESNNLEAVKLLLDHKANIEYQDQDQLTIFDHAVNNGTREILGELLSHFARNDTIRDKSKAFDCAFKKGFLGVGQMLLTPQLIDKPDQYGWTPLHYAVFWQEIYTIKALLSQGAQVNAVDQYGCTALMYAAKNSDEQIVQQLIDENADVLIKDNAGLTALDYARNSNNQKVIAILEPIFDNIEESEWTYIEKE